MIKELNKKLLECSDLHDEENVRIGLIDEWYRYNFAHVANALTKDNDSLKLIIDLDSFDKLEQYCKKLFLLSDVLIIRNINHCFSDRQSQYVVIPANDEIYRCSYDINFSELPPVMLLPPENEGMWTSSIVSLKNGISAPLAAKFHPSFPTEFYQWMLSNNGRSLLDAGRIVYAPFIPPFQMEVEFMSQGFNLPKAFNAQTCYFRDYDWLQEDKLNSLLFLKFPIMENLDFDTMNKIKEDNFDLYKAFSSDMLDTINGIKSSANTADWAKEVRYIQKHKIEENINKIEKTLKGLEHMQSLRKVGYCLTFAGLSLSTAFGFSNPYCSLVSALSSGAKELIERLKEKQQLQENPYYFLWKMGNV